MNLVAMTIPDDPTELPRWLERRLVSSDFARFVAELSAAHPERSKDRLPARQLLGDWYRKALADGLAGVPVGVLKQLLRHPKCLLELQEAILTEGGTYWDAVVNRADDLTPAFDRGKAALEAMFGSRTQPNPPTPFPRREGGFESPSPSGGGVGEGSSRPARSYRTWAIVSSALAACLLVAVGSLTLRGPRQTEVAAANWGWAKPGGIPNEAPKPAEYLNGLANAADEWFDKRPEDAAEVARRINEFRTGCTQLIFSPHAPLAQKDKEWLVGRCRDWAKKLDEHLTALETPNADPRKIRGEADETIRKLQGALRERAGQV